MTLKGLTVSPLGTRDGAQTQACALTRIPTGVLLVHGSWVQPLSHTCQTMCVVTFTHLFHQPVNTKPG